MRPLVACAALLACVLVSRADSADVDLLLKGVTEVVAPGCAVGPVAVFGPDAFPVMTGTSGHNRLPILGAARLGRGRMVLGGHEGLFGSLDRPEQRALATNVVAWLGGTAKPVRVLLHGHRGWQATLAAAGFTVSTADTAHLAEALANTDVVLADGAALTNANPALIGTLTHFIESGGGYFDAVPGWGWMQVTGKSLATDFGTNRICAPAGLAIADGMVGPTGKTGWLADRSGLKLSHAGEAVTALEQMAPGATTLSKEDVAQITETLTNAAGAVPPSDKLLMPRLAALVTKAGASAVPMPKAPLRLDNPLGRIACVLENQQMRSASRLPGFGGQLKAHPAAAGFPGLVPTDAARVDQTVTVDTSVPEWASTGLYAAPGETIEVSLPANAVAAGLGLRIGAHTDGLWHLDRWQRFPEISYATALKQPSTKFGNPFGGVVYVTVPRGCKLGAVPVRIQGAVRMPLFVNGKTPLHEWRSTIRNYPAPWAELATNKIILTVPADVVRNLDDPEAVLSIWDTGMDAIADLGGTSRERERPERIACDQQISAGYMHSGYPIMTWMDVPPVMVDREKLLGGAKYCWGFWHELGHNHQMGWWTFDGTGEVTNNLYSLYCNERVSGEPVLKSTWLNVAERSKTVKKYFADGAKFSQWQSDPGLALMFYAQLQQAFGWGAYRRVFASYRTTSEAALPHNDNEKRDQFLVRFSKEVGRNLGPFFTAWGIPTSEAARQAVANLPPWLPADFKDGIPFAAGG